MMRILSSFFRFCRPCAGPAFGALLAAAFLAGAALAAGVPVPQVRGPLPHPVQNGIRVWGGLGRFGYTVGASIAYAYLPAGIEIGAPVEVDIFGLWVPGAVTAEPLFDPKGERLRSDKSAA